MVITTTRNHLQSPLLATLSVALLAFVIPSSFANAVSSTIIQLTSKEFYEMAMAGEFNVIIDTRTKLEWETGHIENATLIENLQLNHNAEIETDSGIVLKDYLNGCENCPIVVYCRSGSRAAQALELLQEIGFTGLLYNGLGVNQWTEAGYPLVVNKPSLLPPCQNKKKITVTATTNTLMGGAAAVQENVYTTTTGSSNRNDDRCATSTLHGTYDTMAPLIQGGAVTISDDVNVIVNMPVGGGSVITQLTDPPKEKPTPPQQKPPATTSSSSSSSSSTKAFTTFIIGSSTLVIIVNFVSAFVLG